MEKEIVLVKAHSGIPGNEYADFKAREAAYLGSLMNQRQTCTPAGIRQQFYSNRLTKQVKTWNRNALKGLTYVSQIKIRRRTGYTRSRPPRTICAVARNSARTRHTSDSAKKLGTEKAGRWNKPLKTKSGAARRTKC